MSLGLVGKKIGMTREFFDSGISIPNFSSKAITSSTVSKLSAPKSSINLAIINLEKK